MDQDLGERNPSPYTHIGLYKKEIYTSITYESNIDKCVTFITFIYIPSWLWFWYYNNICDVIVNGVNQLKELLVFQMFGHVD